MRVISIALTNAPTIKERIKEIPTTLDDRGKNPY